MKKRISKLLAILMLVNAFFGSAGIAYAAADPLEEYDIQWVQDLTPFKGEGNITQALVINDEELSVLYYDGKCGLIDQSGDILFNPQFATISISRFGTSDYAIRAAKTKDPGYYEGVLQIHLKRGENSEQDRYIYSSDLDVETDGFVVNHGSTVKVNELLFNSSTDEFSTVGFQTQPSRYLVFDNDTVELFAANSQLLKSANLINDISNYETETKFDYSLGLVVEGKKYENQAVLWSDDFSKFVVIDEEKDIIDTMIDPNYNFFAVLTEGKLSVYNEEGIKLSEANCDSKYNKIKAIDEIGGIILEAEAGQVLFDSGCNLKFEGENISYAGFNYYSNKEIDNPDDDDTYQVFDSEGNIVLNIDSGEYNPPEFITPEVMRYKDFTGEKLENLNGDKTGVRPWPLFSIDDNHIMLALIAVAGGEGAYRVVDKNLDYLNPIEEFDSYIMSQAVKFFYNQDTEQGMYYDEEKRKLVAATLTEFNNKFLDAEILTMVGGRKISKLTGENYNIEFYADNEKIDVNYDDLQNWYFHYRWNSENLSHINPDVSNYLVFSKGTKSATYNLNTKEELFLEDYAYVAPYKELLFVSKIKPGGYWMTDEKEKEIGILDNQGNIIINPMFDMVKVNSATNQAFVVYNDKLGILDLSKLPSTAPEVDNYKLTVENGTGSATYKAGVEVEVKANILDGKVFDVWTTSSSGIVFVPDSHSSTVKFTMPASDTRLIATFKDVIDDSTIDKVTEDNDRDYNDDNDWVLVNGTPEDTTGSTKPSEQTETTSQNEQTSQNEPTKPVELPTSVKKFVDVRANDWFSDAVGFIVEKGIMNGTSETTFSPQLRTSRAMLATILYRLAGEAEVTTNSNFDDVVVGSWYAKAVAWAVQNGIVKGYAEDVFKPNQDLTREQLVTMLYRYAKYQSYPVSLQSSLNDFSDANQVSTYAEEAMRWAVGNNIINGVESNILAPQSSATRAQIATMMMRFIEAFVK